MSLVLDSSIALAWCFEDERVPAAVTVLERVVDSGAIAGVVAARSAQRAGDGSAPLNASS
ncbi:MAG: hypothetical protein R3E48_04865 [Burkholderiaceae bacterium]